MCPGVGARPVDLDLDLDSSRKHVHRLEPIVLPVFEIRLRQPDELHHMERRTHLAGAA